MTVQVKICGLTQVDEARACAEAGADAIGLIFYPPSPRFVSIEQASMIVKALPNHVTSVGVFVDLPVESMIYTARTVGFKTIQLHGNETPFTIRILKNEGFQVIKAVRSSGAQLLLDANEFNYADHLLVEASRGELPGGNGAAWNWSEAGVLAPRSFLLAGGLNADNVAQAIIDSKASAVDISSGAESAPGRKDISKVKSIISNVRSIAPEFSTGVVFQ
jgi:phosphoribosylanthranilate isomerase